MKYKSKYLQELKKTSVEPKGSFDTEWNDKPLAKKGAILAKKKFVYRQRNESLNENNFEQPGTKNIDTSKLKLQKQKYTAAMKSHETHKLSDNEDYSVLSNLLKGKYPWGTVNPSTAKAVVNSLRSVDPKVRRHIIMKIYYEPKAFDKFFTEGFVEFDETELNELDAASKRAILSYIESE